MRALTSTVAPRPLQRSPGISREERERRVLDAAAIRAIFAAIGQDLARPEFRGCAFNNASIEFSDPNHPARRAARDYRAELQRRLTDLARAARPDAGPELGAQLAVLVDGMYTSAAHLGPNGPAATGPALAEVLLRERR